MNRHMGMRNFARELSVAAAGAVLLCGALLVASGCDEPDPIPKDVIEAQERARRQAAAVALPTTRELLSAPMQTMRLGDFPLTVEVPKTWALKSLGEGALVYVNGQASSGDISIQLVSQREPVSTERLDALLEAARKEIAAKPHPINRAQVRDLGPGKLLELRVLNNTFVEGKLPPEQWETQVVRDEKTGATAPTRVVTNPHMVKWTLTAFIPAGPGKYTVRALAFQTLKLSEYQQDQELLERIAKSIAYAE